MLQTTVDLAIKINSLPLSAIAVTQAPTSIRSGRRAEIIGARMSGRIKLSNSAATAAASALCGVQPSM
jgi:hypothetical protein